MRNVYFIVFTCLFLMNCSKEQNESVFEEVDLSTHFINKPIKDSLATGKTYLSIYSEIYSFSKHKTHNLTTLVSLKNISEKDTVYISRADYYNTHGDKIETYLKKTIYLKPMETIEIVIDENNSKGGTGSNFIFEWHKKPSGNDPYFEAVMSSTMAQQGLSFTTTGIRMD